MSEIIEIGVSGACPICGHIGCARFHATYDRKGGIVIARFICTTNLKEKKHRTFSLLPWPLIPYRTYDIQFVLRVMRAYREGKDYLTIAHNEEEALETKSELIGSIHDYIALYMLASTKWKTYIRSRTDERDFDLLGVSENELIGMSERFFAATNDFLFGTPSQKRRCRSP